MGLDTELVRLLLEAERSGVVFRRCLTLGRQHYFVGNSETRKLLISFGKNPSRYPQLFSNRRPRYSESFWPVLGVEVLETLDASNFEGATLIHDLNEPVPNPLRDQFDAVVDAGTLEHVFHFPAAISNCMDLVRVGGHLILFTPANNFFGHGFYQFSPELFFRVLSPANGYQMERVVAVEYGPRRRSFEVTDPETIRRRVNVINSFPVLLYVQARRIERKGLLASSPQQSDYFAMWERDQSGARPAGAHSGLGEQVKRFLVEQMPWLARFLEAYKYSSWNRDFSFRDRGAFKRVH
jgi:SAM-dependent methyltransferase